VPALADQLVSLGADPAREPAECLATVERLRGELARTHALGS
jgi:hypothetical protein